MKTAKEDTAKANILNALSYEEVYPDKSIEYAQRALELSEKSEYKKGISFAYSNLGNAFIELGALDKAEEYHSRALKIREQLQEKSLIAASVFNLARIQYMQGNHSKALELNFRALALREEVGDKKAIAATYNNIGGVYFSRGEYDKTIEYIEKALQIEKEIGDKEGMSHALNNLGSIYLQRKEPDKALDYINKGLKLRQELGDKKGEAMALDNIGSIYAELGKKEKGLDYHLQALKLHQEINDKEGIASSYVNLGVAYEENGNDETAIEYFKKGLDAAKEITSREWIKNACNSLSQIFEKKKEYKNAYEFHKLYSDTKDSLLNEESSKQIAEMQTKYETEKKEQQITLLNKDKELQDAQLNRQKIVIWSVVGGLLIVVFLSIFIFRERKKSEKLLLNILPVETAKELKQKGKASPKYYESVTVMFTDFKGFTTIAEKLSAEELVSELDFLFKKFDEIISKYNIEKIKTIGDAYMCVSGLPTPNNNHAENIVNAGLEIQQWMISQNNKWSLRMGIHSGPVTAGVVGDKKFAYDIWGDTVNTASRMESSGEAGKINISGATYQILQGFQNLEGLEFKFRGKIPAKNKGEIEMYFVGR
ncbi:MAG: tetratricopeptide repeat protein [Bacteroidetes bacterium]|nr:tetratricopeptide repeat protein [Bacteroidota bacterium]